MQKTKPQVRSDDQSQSQEPPTPPGTAPPPAAGGGTHNAAYLQEIRKDDIDPEMREVIENALSRQTILGNISEARHHELVWLFRNTIDRIKAYFPPAESSIQGEYRAALTGDENDQKVTLREDQLEDLKQATWAYILDLSRSKDGQQQKWLSNVHQISEQHVSRTDDSGGLTSVFD